MLPIPLCISNKQSHFSVRILNWIFSITFFLLSRIILSFSFSDTSFPPLFTNFSRSPSMLPGPTFACWNPIRVFALDPLSHTLPKFGSQSSAASFPLTTPTFSA